MRSSPKSGQNMDKSEFFLILDINRFFTLEHTEWALGQQDLAWFQGLEIILYKAIIYGHRMALLTRKKSQNKIAWFSVCLREAESKRPMWLINGRMTQTRSHEPANSQLRCLPAALLWQLEQLEHLYDSCWNSWSTYLTAGTAAQPLIISCGCNGCNAVEGTWNSLVVKPWDPNKELATVDIIKVYPRRCSFSLPKVQNLGTTTTTLLVFFG